VASALMASELQKSLARRGEDASDYALMAFGGAGPTHANFLAIEGGMPSIIVPTGSSTFCALGAVLADVMRDYVHSQYLSLDDPEAATGRLREIFAGLEEEASAWIATEGELIGSPEYIATLEMRYAGQAFELKVPLGDELRKMPEAAAVAEHFHREHEKVYGFRDPDSVVEVMTERLRVVGRIPPVELPKIAGDRPRPEARTRRVFHNGGWVDFALFERSALGSGMSLDGPAIVEQSDSTALILPGWVGRMDPIGNLIITREVAA
jgi:N-methylhydantoinase A